MYKIAICDDNKEVCSQIEKLLLKYSDKKDIKIEIDVFYSGEDILKNISKGENFDLIYLDIEMKNISGIEVGKYIRNIKQNYISEIVYISGKDEYDRELFAVQPLNFIPKPIDDLKVINTFELAIKKSEKEKKFFEYKKNRIVHKVAIDEIIYFESVSRQIKIVTINKEDYFYGKLSDILALLAKYKFIQTHRSYIVNYNHIRDFKYDEVVMSNGDNLIISKAQRNFVREYQIQEEE